MTKYTLETISAKLKAVSEPHRLRIWMALQEEEQCLCHLVEMLGLAASTVSKHTDILQKAGWLTTRRQGKWAFFKAVKDPQLAAWLSLQGVDQITELKQDLTAILTIPNEECC